MFISLDNNSLISPRKRKTIRYYIHGAQCGWPIRLESPISKWFYCLHYSCSFLVSICEYVIYRFLHFSFSFNIYVECFFIYILADVGGRYLYYSNNCIIEEEEKRKLGVLSHSVYMAKNPNPACCFHFSQPCSQQRGTIDRYGYKGRDHGAHSP